jgi:hypothetical protein
LFRIGKLKRHRAEAVEVRRLLESAQVRVCDAAVPGISASSRFSLAYDCILAAAGAAMLANGFRPATSEPGHHQVLIQSLVKTAGIAPESVAVLDAYRKLRNKSDYEGIPVAESVADSCRESAREVLDAIRAWIREHRPELGVD